MQPWNADVLHDDMRADSRERLRDALMAVAFYPVLLSTNKRTAVLRTEYRCEDRCNLVPVLRAMRDCAALQEWQADRACAEIVETIAEYQEECQPHCLDGLCITRNGREIVHARNSTTPQSAPTMFIEYHDVRRELGRLRRQDQREQARARASSGLVCAIC
jgi:hypothetical protein